MRASVGLRIREVLAISEKIGRPATYNEIHAQMDCELTNTFKYCQRAVERGFLIVDRSVKPATYMATPNWGELVGEYIKPQPRAKAAFVHKLPKRIISSVFSLGNYT